jgi:hypothetical protein
LCDRVATQYQAGERRRGEQWESRGWREGQENSEGVGTRATGNKGKGTDATLPTPSGSRHVLLETGSLEGTKLQVLPAIKHADDAHRLGRKHCGVLAASQLDGI